MLSNRQWMITWLYLLRQKSRAEKKTQNCATYTKYQNVVNCFFFALPFVLSLCLRFFCCCGFGIDPQYFFFLSTNAIQRFIFPRAYIFWPFFFSSLCSFLLALSKIGSSKRERTLFKEAKKQVGTLHIFIIINYSIIKSKWLVWRYPNGNWIQRSSVCIRIIIHM